MDSWLLEQVTVEMTDGGVDRSVECSEHLDAMISEFVRVDDVCSVLPLNNLSLSSNHYNNFRGKKMPMNLIISGQGSGCSCWGAP